MTNENNDLEIKKFALTIASDLISSADMSGLLKLKSDPTSTKTYVSYAIMIAKEIEAYLKS